MRSLLYFLIVAALYSPSILKFLLERAGAWLNIRTQELSESTRLALKRWQAALILAYQRLQTELDQAAAFVLMQLLRLRVILLLALFTFMRASWVSGLILFAFAATVTLTLLSLAGSSLLNTDLESNQIFLTNQQKFCVAADSFYLDIASMPIQEHCQRTLQSIKTGEDTEKSTYRTTDTGDESRFLVCKWDHLFCHLSEQDKNQILLVARIWPYITLFLSVGLLAGATFLWIRRIDRKTTRDLVLAMFGIAILLHIYQEVQISQPWITVIIKDPGGSPPCTSPEYLIGWDQAAPATGEFALGRYRLPPIMQTKLDNEIIPDINGILGEGAYNALLIEGHTDGAPIKKNIDDKTAAAVFRDDIDSKLDNYLDKPIDTTIYANSNIELGYLRAFSVMKYLEGKVNAKAMHIASFSCNKDPWDTPTYSKCSDSGENAKKRRVVIRLYRYDSDHPDASEIPGLKKHSAPSTVGLD